MARSKNVKFKLNRSGVRDLLTSGDVVADIQRRAQAVATMANVNVGADGAHDVLDTTSNRARATIMTSTKAAADAEATNHTLTAALGASRG